jgi:hypothetical protein
MLVIFSTAVVSSTLEGVNSPNRLRVLKEVIDGRIARRLRPSAISPSSEDGVLSEPIRFFESSTHIRCIVRSRVLRVRRTPPIEPKNTGF